MVSNYLSKEIFVFIKGLVNGNKIKKGFGYSFHLKYFSEDISKEILVILKVNYLNDSKENVFSVNGNYVLRKNKNRKSDFVIDINLYSNFSKQAYPAFVQKISNVLRHELEHFRQDNMLKDGVLFPDYDKNKLNSDDVMENFYERLKYIKNQFEQDAFIREYMRYAKRTKQSIFELLEEFIGQQLFNNDIKVEEVVKFNIKENLDNIKNDLRSSYKQKVNLIYTKINLPKK